MTHSHCLSISLAAIAMVLGGIAPAAEAADGLDDESTRREIGQAFGKCVAEGRRLKPHAIRFVLTGDIEEGGRLSVADSCLLKAAKNHLRGGDYVTGAWAPDIFRKIVADGLVRTDFSTSGPTDFSAVPALDPNFSMSALMSSQLPQAVQLTLAVDPVAECAARKEPESVRLLAQTAVGSPEELAALRGLAPAFGACLPSEIAVNFPRYLLRDAAVLAYARLAYSLATAGSTQEPAE